MSRRGDEGGRIDEGLRIPGGAVGKLQGFDGLVREYAFRRHDAGEGETAAVCEREGDVAVVFGDLEIAGEIVGKLDRIYAAAVEYRIGAVALPIDIRIVALPTREGVVALATCDAVSECGAADAVVAFGAVEVEAAFEQLGIAEFGAVIEGEAVDGDVVGVERVGRVEAFDVDDVVGIVADADHKRAQPQGDLVLGDAGAEGEGVGRAVAVLFTGVGEVVGAVAHAVAVGVVAAAAQEGVGALPAADNGVAAGGLEGVVDGTAHHVGAAAGVDAGHEVGDDSANQLGEA